MKTININLKKQDYPIFLQKGILQTSFVFDVCKKLASSFAIITHDNLKDLLAKDLLDKFQDYKVKLFSFEQGEHNKTRETKHKLEDQLLENNFTKDTLIIAVGGGVVLDLCGYLASTYLRGVRVVYIPTTLLAMVDACIGGKTAVNTSHGKNMIGSFYNPRAVFIDIEALNTLPSNEYKNGLVEMLKHGLIKDKEYFYRLLDTKLDQDLIERSLLIKKEIIEKDEKDKDLRKVLNLGHSIAHGIEKSLEYRISHGSAVLFGIVVECYISNKLKILSQKNLDEILQSLNDQIPSFPKINIKDVLSAMKLDKKRSQNNANFSLLEDFNKAKINVDVSEELIEQSIKWGIDAYSNNNRS